MVAKKRYHHSKRNISEHDRMMDRENLMKDGHGRDSIYKNEDYRSRSENPSDRTVHMKQRYNDERHNDRMDERAVYRRFRALGNEFYAGMEPRRRQEMEDAGYIHEDHDAIANLPQYPIIKSYPRTGPYLPEGLDDTIEGIDHQMDYDDGKRREHFYPKKH